MSRCVVRDNTVYLAGLTASDTTQDIKGQTKQILDKIDGYLAQAGTSTSNLLSANLWIKDMALFADMNSVWNAWVDPENLPARACVKADLARPSLSRAALRLTGGRELEDSLRQLVEEGEDARDIISGEQGERRQTEAVLRCRLPDIAGEQADYCTEQQAENHVLLNSSAVSDGHQGLVDPSA
jgi:enamine deaminase RidA (YjgF/YER057c/UK114 family)